MSRAMVELDFFGIEKDSSNKTQFQKLFNRRRSFRGFQSAISKINPQVLKTVIGSGSGTHIPNGKAPENGNFFPPKKSFSVPSTPKGNQCNFPPLPVYNPTPRPTSESPNETAPMTIFYNGTVSVFDVSRDQAESILKLAVEGSYKPIVESADPKLAVSSIDQQQLLESLEGDLPIARRKSLKRFLEKRKERLTSVAPYACRTDYAFSEDKTTKDLFQA